MNWHLPTKEELKRNAEGARRATYEYQAKMEYTRDRIKSITLSSDEVIDMMIGTMPLVVSMYGSVEKARRLVLEIIQDNNRR